MQSAPPLKDPPMRLMTRLALVALLPAWAALPAMATELYVPLGVPGVGLGVAQPLPGGLFGLRADFMTLGQRSRDTLESGISYRGQVKLGRAALLADVFPFGGWFRFTAGATVNDYSIALDATGAGGTLTIGDRTYTTTAADGLNVQVKFPRTTPYLGLGWGHQSASGWRFSADLGAALGKATVSATPRGALAAQADIQTNIDKELLDLRDGVGKVKAIPQLSVGVGYAF
jgi:hypothetical protein